MTRPQRPPPFGSTVADVPAPGDASAPNLRGPDQGSRRTRMLCDGRKRCVGVEFQQRRPDRATVQASARSHRLGRRRRRTRRSILADLRRGPSARCLQSLGVPVLHDLPVRRLQPYAGPLHHPGRPGCAEGAALTRSTRPPRGSRRASPRSPSIVLTGRKAPAHLCGGATAQRVLSTAVDGLASPDLQLHVMARFHGSGAP